MNKKYNKTKLVICIILSIVMLAGTGSREILADTIKYIPISKAGVRYLGRTMYSAEEDTRYFNYTCSGMEFYFTGKELKAKLVTDEASVQNPDIQSCIGVFVNDSTMPDLRFRMNLRSGNYTIFKSDTTQTVKIKIIKLSEAKRGKSGIQGFYADSGAKLTPTKEKDYKIEFIGDSITCGYGIEGIDGDKFSTSAENGAITYASQTAQRFDADYNVIAVSGIGVAHSNFDKIDQQKNIVIGDIYPYSDYLMENRTMEIVNPKKWKFSQYQPDLVVINLGVNDNSYVQQDKEKRREFGYEYYSLIDMVRENNPKATILCAIREENKFLYDEIEYQANEYAKAASDKKIFTMLLPKSDKEDGKGTLKHPNYKTHNKMAEAMIQKLIEIMPDWV